MIVGTAGHIDHGKTTLVKALTGTDTDRLPEEKARGISIELGYAFTDDGQGGRIGFVDVPGHERLVHTMLAGATGIDVALLLVAADDGPMPQTHEHLAVLSLLGLQRGAVVVTKADRVDGARLDAVSAEAHALLDGTPLAGAPVHAVSATTGRGVDTLRTWLRDQARTTARAADDRAFRIAIDRAFTLDGVGTVATGTVHAGRVAVGDELRIVPGERLVRVRSVHAQGRAAAAAGAGERCALGLAGVARDELQRGQWIVDPAVALETARLDVRLQLWHAEAKPLRSGTPVHVHVGSASTMGTVAVLRSEAADQLAPGEQGLVQLVLRVPVGAWHGDRVVLRDASGTRTLAGGTALDPHAPTRYRRTTERLAELDALALADPAARAAARLARAPLGVDWSRYAAAQGRGPAAAGTVAGPAAGAISGGDFLLARAHADAVRDAMLAALTAYHERLPDEAGPDAARLRRLAAPRLPEPLYRALLAELQAQGAVAVRGAFVHRPEHAVRLSATEERIAQKVAPRLAESGYEGAWARDLARDSGESEALLRTTLARLAQRGELHQVVKDLYYPQATMATLAGLARRLAREEGMVTAARFRDETKLGRKRAIQILEYFDRVGLTRRVGDEHRVRSDATVFQT
ncbi:MAG: selenocysteine-specific translation elongation factor [Rubrivivax sp.]|nr:selenocysteine-specific translation elongation factor [Rubrivivax sp.]